MSDAETPANSEHHHHDHSEGPGYATPQAAIEESEPEEIAYVMGLYVGTDVDANETVLDAAERADLGLPYGCLTGACATCTGRLREGDVAYRRPPRALKERQRRDGYVLLCIAEPRSDCHVEVGARIQASMVSNP